MNIPFLNLKNQYQEIKEEIKSSVSNVLESQNFILGEKVRELEKRIAAYCGAGYAVGVSSGTDALLASLMALGIGCGDRVITSTYSFFATAGVIVRTGAEPLFVDIDPLTYNISPDKLLSLLRKGKKCKALVPVHLFGQSADMDSIIAQAKEYGLYVVEDTAQAIGARYKDKAAGTFGDMGCLSFYPSKNLGGYGDGGMVLTNNRKLADKLAILRNHGAKTNSSHSVIGGNFRLDELQAAILLVKLKYLDRWTDKRRKIADAYNKLFLKKGLTDVIKLPYASPGNYHVFNQYVIRVPKRDGLRVFLRGNGIKTMIYYPLPFHLQKCFSYLGYKRGDFPESEKASRETLALPIYPELTEEERVYVVDKIREFFSRR